MEPEVSVVIPTIGRRSLHEALESVRRQGRQVEILVIDDSGTGELPETLSPETRVVRTAGRIGAAEARNVGMAQSRGRYIAFLDDDDVWLPGHLDDAVRTLDSRPEIDVYAARGLVLGDDGGGRVEPVVLVGERSVADYFFERAAWRSRCRRILTPTLVFRAALGRHRMDSSRTVNEDTWWLLTAERDLGVGLFQSAHVGVVVHSSDARNVGRWREDLGDWLDRAEGLRAGAAATEQLSMFGRDAVRSGRPRDLVPLSRDILARERGWTWAPVLALHLAAAGAVAATRRHRR